MKSTERQKADALKFIESKGWVIRPEHIYEDLAQSGAEFNRRAGLNALLTAANRKEFSVVVMTNLSRLGRDLVGVNSTLQRLTDQGVTVYECDNGQPVKFETSADVLIT